MTRYTPFPKLGDWLVEAIDLSQSDGLKDLADRMAHETPEVLRAAREIVKRLAAIETGKIENLYDLERGLTITAAMDGAVLEALRKGKIEDKHALIDGQLAAYDSVLDFVTGRQPMAEAWIRELHVILCKNQITRIVHDADGKPREVPFEPGKYKTEDNHVQTENGVHYYATALETPAEMGRLIEAVNSEAFEKLHPIDQAAYFHYSFAAIHPFADGNGRVARALTSIPTYRHYRVPILIVADQRDLYFDALAIADSGAFKNFRLFIRNRIVESVLFLEQSVRRAHEKSPEAVSGSIARHFTTRGGYSHVGIDEAADSMLTYVAEQFSRMVGRQELRPPGLSWSVGQVHAHRDPRSIEYRRVLSIQERLVQLHGITSAPADASITVHIGVEIPRDAGTDDYFVLECGVEPGAPSLKVAVSEVVPRRNLITEMRLTMFVEEVFGYVGVRLNDAALKSLRAKGYLEN